MMREYRHPNQVEHLGADFDGLSGELLVKVVREVQPRIVDHAIQKIRRRMNVAVKMLEDIAVMLSDGLLPVRQWEDGSQNRLDAGVPIHLATVAIQPLDLVIDGAAGDVPV